MDDPVASGDAAAPASNDADEAGDDEEAGDEEAGDEDEAEEEAADEAEGEEAEGEEAAEHETLPAAPAVAATEADVATAPPAAPAAAVKISVAGLDATTAKILERAARFGTSIPSNVQAKLEEEKRAARAARFGLETKAPEEAKEKKNNNKNKSNNNNNNGNQNGNKKGAENQKGNAKGQQPRSTGSAAVDEAMLKRIARFGAVAPAAQQFEAASKLQKRKERFGNASGEEESKPQAKKQKTEPRVVDPEMQAKLDARAKRFAANSSDA